ncbi:iron-siderophore ABC transporter substrate-binding protein [Nocardiopsis sp. MG754419]|uniref:ABC transporter substrate-binding protein n=1 Tax=Nocardiopsis sp. MG754419 TaxID=2259865 RepID=UPI001BAA834F|nr:iron-siderophore ABC transporter substrate-binding protein [Nocardiopsis sp. MG754419]MBR8740869.1 iron-siderophore ABC transporter substrate-binding protein [Nocardiopsis sp. MG754419]
MTPHARPTRTGLTALAAASTLLLAACGASGPDTETTDDGSAGEGFPLTVEHALGSTEVPAAPARILPLDFTYVDATLALGGTVVGYTQVAENQDALPAYLSESDWNTGDASEATSVGLLWEISPELVAQVEPDLILSAKVRHGDGYDQLSEVAPTVMSTDTGDSWKENLLLTGEAMGQVEEAERLVTEFEERAAAIGEEIAAADDGDPPSVSVVRFAGDAEGVRLYSRHSYIGVILDDVGLPASENTDTETEEIATYHSPERLLDLDAEHILVATYDDGEGEVDEAKEQYVTNPLWEQLEGEKTEVDDDHWMSGVGLISAHRVLDDIAATFEVDPRR